MQTPSSPPPRRGTEGRGHTSRTFIADLTTLIINRYITLEIAKPLLLICTILAVIYASFSSAVYLADAAQGLLSGAMVINMALLKTLIGLEALLPTSLYLAIVIGLGRMYNDSEMTALYATGYSELQVLKSSLPLIILTAVLVGMFSIYLRPWAYQTVYRMEAQALAELDINKLEAGRFYKLGQTEGVLFAEHISREFNRLDGVFFRDHSNGDARIVRAEEAYLSTSASGAVPVMIFINGKAYNLDHEGHEDLEMTFKKLTFYINDFADSSVNYKRKAVPIGKLMDSDSWGDMAEYQWRLSMPVVTVILGLLAIPLSRSRPRQGRFAKIAVAILVFALYYNLVSVARTWVDQGRLPEFPGMWTAHVLPVMLLVFLIAQPYMKYRFMRKARTADP